MASSRLALAILCVAATGIAGSGCNEILGFGDPKLAPLGEGGSSTTASSTATGMGGSGGELPPPPCHPSNVDTCSLDNDCLALADNSALDSWALRVSQVTIRKPDALAPPEAGNALITSAVKLNLRDCNLRGSGYLSWLLAYDETSGIGRLGASKPVTDPFMGYSFVDEVLISNGFPFQVSPANMNATIGADGTITAELVDAAVLPIYTDAMGSDYVLVPLHDIQIRNTKISTDHNCIGRYNAEGLREEDGCLEKPSDGIFAFVDGGEMEGWISLEEADNVIVYAFGLNRSLCVILSGDAGMFGTGDPQRCQRINNGVDIKFPGDWCSATNSGSDSSCHDAVFFSQGFAASAVKLNP